jgi:hypothetical protein
MAEMKNRSAIEGTKTPYHLRVRAGIVKGRVCVDTGEQ